jgi:hypothetical protein
MHLLGTGERSFPEPPLADASQGLAASGGKSHGNDAAGNPKRFAGESSFLIRDVRYGSELPVRLPVMIGMVASSPYVLFWAHHQGTGTARMGAKRTLAGCSSEFRCWHKADVAERPS